MLKPKKTYIIAPSSPPKNNRWKKNFEILKSWGLTPDFPAFSLNPNFFHAHKDSKRAFFLKRAFDKKPPSFIWMLRGGYGCQKLQTSFPHLDLKGSKLFIGYSDGTALHLYLNAKNKVSLHAPVVSELHELSARELSALKALLLGQKKQLRYNNLKILKSKTAELSFKTWKGKITGGNLSLISTSIGASALPPFEFLFLEDVNEPAYKIDRFLHHLLYAGALKSSKAILFGDFYPLKNKELEELLKNFSKSCPLPLVWGLPCGHQKRMPLFFNTPAQLSLGAEKASLTVDAL